MQIKTESAGDVLAMRVSGRLDNESSEHLTTAINDAVRMGSHILMLDLKEVEYISSAGVGALIKAHRQFQSLRGSMAIVGISPEAAEVIRLTGLAKMLLADLPSSREGTSVAMAVVPASPESTGVMNYELYELKRDASLTCEVIGDPGPFTQSVFRTSDCQAVAFPDSAIGLGLGAFGRDFDDCSDRFGEFLSVAGCAVQQPTSAAGKPDYQRRIGEFVPCVQTLYGLRCRGEFSHLVRFDRQSAESRLTLSALVDQVLTLGKTDLAAIVLLAESSGLIGAGLRRSPVMANSADSPRLRFPEIRKWLSFSPEHAHTHTLTLAVGVVSRGSLTGSAAALTPLLRPLAPGSNLMGHAHAAVFSYRPFKKRKLDLNETVSSLFETEDLKAVLHLLHDDREISGGGESEFVSGACWVGPIASTQRLAVGKEME